MHSNLDDDLNFVFVASAYLGLMNSAINPLVSYNTVSYSFKENNKQFIFPGYFEKPCSSTGSPP